MAKPKKTSATTWSVRMRAGGDDRYLSGFPTAAAANRAARDIETARRNRGRPEGLGPRATILAQGLSDWGVQTLPFQKSAPQTVRRINRYLRLAKLPELVLEPATHSTDSDEPKAKPGRRRKDAPPTHYFDVRLQTEEERREGRRIVDSLREHRATRAAKTSASDRQRRLLACTAVADITRQDVQTLIDAMRKESAGQGSLQQEQALLRGFFYFVDETWNWPEPARNPATGLKLPRVDNARDRVMSEDEEARLLKALEDARNPAAVLVIQMLVETAMRCGEPLEHAHWGNVDWNECILRLDDGKTGKREVPLSPRAVELLQELHGVGPRHPNEPIVRLSYEALKAVWTRACERAGICDLVLHDLRHTAATRFALKTGNVFLVQKLTGHKTLSQVQRYVNVKAKDAVRAMRQPTGPGAVAGLPAARHPSGGTAGLPPPEADDTTPVVGPRPDRNPDGGAGGLTQGPGPGSAPEDVGTAPNVIRLDFRSSRRPGSSPRGAAA